eukprot:COSAG02_NODE_31465_length_533_cov_0.824885_1_plen_83_part_01
MIYINLIMHGSDFVISDVTGGGSLVDRLTDRHTSTQRHSDHAPYDHPDADATPGALGYTHDCVSRLRHAYAVCNDEPRDNKSH